MDGHWDICASVHDARNTVVHRGVLYASVPGDSRGPCGVDLLYDESTCSLSSPYSILLSAHRLEKRAISMIQCTGTHLPIMQGSYVRPAVREYSARRNGKQLNSGSRSNIDTSRMQRIPVAKKFASAYSTTYRRSWMALWHQFQRSDSLRCWSSMLIDATKVK